MIRELQEIWPLLLVLISLAAVLIAGTGLAERRDGCAWRRRP